MNEAIAILDSRVPIPAAHAEEMKTQDGRLSQVFRRSAMEQKRLNLLLLLVVVIPVRYMRIAFCCVSVSWLTIFIDLKERPGYAFVSSKNYFYSWTNTYQDFLESELPLILSYSCLLISMSLVFSWKDTRKE